MEYLPNQETLVLWLTHYGSWTLFVLLALGIIALPVPEETLMIIAGALIRNGTLHVVPTLLATYGGSLCGITMSYFLGRAFGKFFILKYGSWIGITEKRLNLAHDWFERYGKWSLSIGYFIPGVRHFTGFIAGSTNLEYPIFALFAYVGGVLWATTFLSIGYFFGNYWSVLFEEVEISADWVTVGIILVSACYIYYVFRRRVDS